MCQYAIVDVQSDLPLYTVVGPNSEKKKNNVAVDGVESEQNKQNSAVANSVTFSRDHVG